MTTQTTVDPAASVAAKVHRRIIPLLFTAWFIAYIDRFNVSFAALQMNAALGLSSAAFGFGAGVFFLGYALLEVPSNLILARVGARWWLGRIMVSWGVITVAMMFTESALSFYVLRFLLGVAEAGCFPGLAYYLSQWLSPRYRAAALGTLGTAAMSSGIFGGPIAAALLTMDGAAGLAGWQWLFLLEGVPAVIVGLLVLMILPERPEAVKWLTNEERRWVAAHASAETLNLPVKQSIVAVVTDPKTWVWSSAFFFASATGSSYQLFRPMILQHATGLNDAMTAAVTAVPGVVGVVAMIYWSRRSTRVDERRWHASIPWLIGALGVALFGVAGGLATALVFSALATVGGAAQPPLFASVSAHFKGSINAVAIALVNGIGALGGFAGPYVLGQLIENGGIPLACAIAGLSMTTSALLVVAVTDRIRLPRTEPRTVSV